MAYVTAVTDRDAADIVARNSKAFWNVADWTRVYNNTLLVYSLIEAHGSIFTPTLLSSPVITTIPSVTDFNLFLANIENIRAAVSGEPISGISIAIKTDWIAGPGQPAPKYSDANLWESTLDAIWNYYGGPSLPVCPTLAADLTITTGNQGVYVDCIDAANFDIDLQGTANLYII